MLSCAELLDLASMIEHDLEATGTSYGAVDRDYYAACAAEALAHAKEYARIERKTPVGLIIIEYAVTLGVGTCLYVRDVVDTQLKAARRRNLAPPASATVLLPRLQEACAGLRGLTNPSPKTA
jgi:hypothetical protein